MNKIDLPEGLAIRAAMPMDKEFIANLFHSTNSFLFYASQEKEYIQNILDHQQLIQEKSYTAQAPNLLEFIIEKQSVAIGKLTIDFGRNMAHILDVSFIEKARHRGYGKAVLQAIQHTACQQGLPVALSVAKQNLAAKHLYTALGFVAVEDMTTHLFLIWYPPQHKIYG